jgi:hypothetical protein
VSYVDSQAARTTLVILAVHHGITRRRRCVKPARHAHGKSCLRLVKVGMFTHSDRAGQNKLHFTGRIGAHALPPGRYRLKLTPRLAAKTGKAITLSFQVLR